MSLTQFNSQAPKPDEQPDPIHMPDSKIECFKLLAEIESQSLTGSKQPIFLNLFSKFETRQDLAKTLSISLTRQFYHS